MQRPGMLDSRSLCDGDARSQGHVDKPAATGSRLLHCALRVVFVRGNNYSGFGAEVEVPEHVTTRQCGNKHFLRIVSRGIAPEGRVGRAGDRRLTLNVNFMGTLVGPVARRTLTRVAGPTDRGRVLMEARHRQWSVV